MRHPLVTMTRIARALIQCVTRTTSGWILIHCSSIDSPRPPFSPWSETIAYTLQAPPPVAFAKAKKRRAWSFFERDRLEQLAHLSRAHQAVRLVGERQEPRLVLGRGALHQLGDAAVDEELRLARVPGEPEAGLARCRGDRAEVDMARDVLKPREEERVGVRVVAVVAHQRSFPALRMVVLPARKPVVDEQRDAFLEHAAERAHEAARGEPDLGAEAFRKPELARRLQELARRDAPRPVEALAAHPDPAFLDPSAVDAHDVNRHRIQDLVADHDAGEGGRQAVQPRHALEQVRHPRGERVAAALAQVGRELEDQVAVRRRLVAVELLEKRCRERTASCADLEDLVESRAQDLPHLARERLTE